MTHHLTHDLCRRLRDAGLPQPEKQPGQFWHMEHSVICICKNTLRDDLLFYFDPETFYSGSMSKKEKPYKWLIFYPDLEYLLQHLPNEPSLRRDSHGKWYFGSEKMDGLKITGFDIIAEADNPLEAAALAYLHFHKKTPANLDVS